VLDAARTPVFVRDGFRVAAPIDVVAIGGDVGAPLNDAAIALLPTATGREADVVPLLAAYLRQPVHRQAAMAAIRKLPPTAWPAAEIAPLADTVLGHLKTIKPADRTGPAFAETMAFGRELAARLPDADRRRVATALDALVVRVIRIEAVASQMKFDISRFTVATGEEVVIELVNKDEMPHNLLVTKEGALETVSLAAEKMISLPDAFAKSFIPQTPEVLFSIRLLQPNETLQVRFTAPADPGNYPFVCTFPGHWRTMNGIVEVVRQPAQVSQP
jgi:azurin